MLVVGPSLRLPIARYARSLSLITTIFLASIPGCRESSSNPSAHAHKKGRVQLYAGMQAVHFPVAGANKEAQAFFDQGLTLLYGFNFREAILSFQRSSELAPNAPMPFWGIALANGPNYNHVRPGSEDEREAFRAIQNALERIRYGSQEERELVIALETRFTNGGSPNFQVLASRYAAKMEDLSSRYRNDPNVAAFFAESLMDLDPHPMWTNEGGAREHTLQAVGVLEAALLQWPNHIGLNHFYIHAMEASPYPERALNSADKLNTLAPSIGHLVHMPSHIYFRIGAYDRAEKSNLDAIQADRVYLEDRTEQNVDYVLGYVEHNYMALISAAEMNGDFETAYSAAISLRNDVSPLAPRWQSSASYLVAPLQVLTRFGHWEQILQEDEPKLKLPELMFFWHYARGCSYAALGKKDFARSERLAMEQIFGVVPPYSEFGLYHVDWNTVYQLADNSLGARIAFASGDRAGAIAQWTDAIALQDGMSYHEPPGWYYPARESLGSLFFRIAELKRAEQVFLADLKRNPRNPRSLFGLWRTQVAEHRVAVAEATRKLFCASWKGNADPLLDDF